MAVIGIDSSGKAGQPPIYMVAVRDGDYRCVHLSPSAEYRYRGAPRWKYKITAALIFRAANPIFVTGDALEIDEDFVGHSKQIESYVTRLFISLRRAKPEIYFSNRLGSERVRRADVHTKLAKGGLITIHESDPDLEKEFKILGAHRASSRV